MSSAERYRARAAQLAKEAEHEPRPKIRTELESLAHAYLRLAEQADRNDTTDIVYMTPDRGQESSEA